MMATSARLLLGTGGAVIAALACGAAVALSPVPAAGALPAAIAASGPVPSAAAFRGPREAWERLASALARHDRAAAMQELTPSARARHGADIEEWLAAKPFDRARFGKVRSVTLSGERFATVTLTRRKDDGMHAYEVMLMRGDDGRWRIDRM